MLAVALLVAVVGALIYIAGAITGAMLYGSPVIGADMKRFQEELDAERCEAANCEEEEPPEEDEL